MQKNLEIFVFNSCICIQNDVTYSQFSNVIVGGMTSRIAFRFVADHNRDCIGII